MNKKDVKMVLLIMAISTMIIGYDKLDSSIEDYAGRRLWYLENITCSEREIVTSEVSKDGLLSYGYDVAFEDGCETRHSFGIVDMIRYRNY